MRDGCRAGAGDGPGVTAGPPLGRYHQVGGRRLLLHRAGVGGPAVVFLAGAGTVGLDYWNLQEQAARFTTSVLYDRAGTGWSDPGPLPRTAGEVTDELRELLTVVGIPGPCVLVGHSLGGLYARHYAQRFPDEVAGLVLVDPAHEDYNAYMPRELIEAWESWQPPDSGGAAPGEYPAEAVRLYRGLFAEELADWPADLRDLLVERHVSPAWLRVGAEEAKNVDDLYAEVRGAGPLPDVPLIVLAAADVDAFRRSVGAGQSEALMTGEIAGKTRLYEELAATVRRGECRVVGGAGHSTVCWRRGDAVLRAIRDVGRGA